MASKLNYTPETILNIKFSPTGKGYDPLEVDSLFDSIIEDYKALLLTIDELQNDKNKLSIEVNKLKEELSSKTLDLATLRKQMSALPRASGITDDNFKLMKKITAYERVLHRKGIDLKKALSDPDNC